MGMVQNSSGSGLTGGRINPAATSLIMRTSMLSSCAIGSSLAIGSPRSVTMISSPAFTASRCSLNFAFNMAIGTLFTDFHP